MRRFLVDIIIVLCLLYIAVLGVDICISRYLQHSRQQMLAGWNDIINTDIDADMLIIGSSRALVQYDPRILDSILSVNSYNLGLDGSPFHRQYAKYKAYLEYQKCPQYIVVNIDHFLLRPEQEFERESFFPYLITPSLRKYILPIQSFTWCERYVPTYRYIANGGIEYLLNKYSQDDHLYKGYLAKDLEWDSSIMQQIENRKFLVNVDERSKSYFEAFLEETHKKAIKVIFCYAPMYVENTKRVTNLGEFKNEIEEYATQYDIPILDYTYSDISYDTTYFYNITHLNRIGAECFTNQLAKDIDSKGLMKNEH